MFKTTNPNGFHITFTNGCTISVQWNNGNYCSNRDLYAPYSEINNPRECNTVEIAAWDAKGAWIKLGENDDVVGWQTPEEMIAIMAIIAAR